MYKIGNHHSVTVYIIDRLALTITYKLEGAHGSAYLQQVSEKSDFFTFLQNTGYLQI